MINSKTAQPGNRQKRASGEPGGRSVLGLMGQRREGGCRAALYRRLSLYTPPVRVLMVSKACLVGVYQRKLEEMAACPDLELTVAVPASWRDERGVMRLERAH